MSIWLRLFAPLLVLRPGLGFVTGSSFSGSLERVGNGSISVRLVDHRVIDAMLPNTPPLDATSVVAQYSMGDQVEVTCKPIQPVWEEATSRYQSLQVTAIRLIRRPAPEELSKILAVVPFQEGKNLLKRPVAVSPPIQIADLKAPGGKELAHARQVNLEYAASMPNFVADETAKRYRSSPGSSSWRDFDTVESEITFRGNHAARQRIRRNGKAWDQPFEALPGFKWYEGFGTEIRPLFDPTCPTTLEYQGRSKVRGRPLLDYRFTTPVDGCFPFFFFGYQRYNPARTGHVFIDDPAGNIMQLDEDASGFPAEIEFAEREEHISWDYVKVGEESHLLPIRANFLVRYYDGTRYRIDAEFKNHRHFEASSNITFQ
ncbi:MAG TPA: hypothetical protein VIY49_07200 [Bryobacteraceae bacterium]